MAKSEFPDRDAKERKARQSVIGSRLKRLYDEVAQEDVPDDFLKLLEEADERSSDDN